MIFFSVFVLFITSMNFEFFFKWINHVYSHKSNINNRKEKQNTYRTNNGNETHIEQTIEIQHIYNGEKG